ncbi:MAG: hypothetical protein LLG04_04200 [Parachlamydia sp.]|nr:hypothetical protein [Parachlamydia sp.]
MRAPLTKLQRITKNVAFACFGGAALAGLSVLTAHLSFRAVVWITAGKFIPLQAAILLSFAPCLITAAQVAALVGIIALAGLIISRVAGV